MTTADGFFDVPRSPHPTSRGPVELPILYRDATTVVAMFAVDRARAADALVDTGLVPLPLPRGRALAAVAFYEYRTTSVGRYNEVGVALMVTRAGEPARPWRWADLARPPAVRRLGMYVLDLPVSTPLADAAGRELWGYPKFVTELPLRVAGREVDATVLDPDGRTIVTFAGRLGPGVPAPPLSLMTYTRLGGSLIRTHVDVRGRSWLRAPGSARLRLGASPHGMATRLRALGLVDARPAVVLATDRFQSRLHAGTPAP